MTAPPHCANHPASPGIALCIGCSRVLCGACTTRIQGRNLCVSCLADELDASEVAESQVGPVFVLAVHFAAGLGLVLTVLALAGVGLALHALG